MKIRSSLSVLISLFLLSIGLVLLLLINASMKGNNQRHTFLRKFVYEGVRLTNILDLKLNSYYIAGATSSDIYFGNVTDPWHLLVTNKTLSNTRHVEIKTEGKADFKFHSIFIEIDSPNFYFVEPSTPAVFVGGIDNWYGYLENYRVPFIKFSSINNFAFVMKAISSETKEFTLGKQMKFSPFIKLAPRLLEKQIDGRFCVDGMLHFNKDLSMLVYVYYYRNQFICADTNLNLLYRGNTIDTISRAQITIAEIQSNNVQTLSSPPLLVNKKSCSSGNWLFINSNLLAKNEDIDFFQKYAVIDIYNLKDGKYEFSFYIMPSGNETIREFKVFENVLIALSDHYVMRFEFEPDFFDNASSSFSLHSAQGSLNLHN